MTKLAPHMKAVVAFFAPTVTALVGNLEEALRTGAAINWKLQAAVAALALWGAIIVWATRNTPSSQSVTGTVTVGPAVVSGTINTGETLSP